MPGRSGGAPFAALPASGAYVGGGGRGASRAGLGLRRSRLTHFLLLNSYRNSSLFFLQQLLDLLGCLYGKLEVAMQPIKILI